MPVKLTPAFEQWFKGSKVVDTGGKPLVVYHGYAGRKFNIFKDQYAGRNNNNDLSSMGFFFTPDPTTADDYAYQAAWNIAPEDKEFIGAGQRMHEVYLSLQNPVAIDGSKISSDAAGVKELVGIISKAKASGSDGAILRGWEDGSGKHDQYIAFSSNQIKSAVGNNGDFDMANPDIRFSMADVNEVEDEADNDTGAPCP